MEMSPRQCRAARAALDITQAKLAKMAGVTRGVVADFERSKRDTINATFKQLQGALENEGIVFTLNSAGKKGVFFDYG